MPVTVSGQKYYRTAEVCRMVGISRTTLFRWLTEGVLNEPEHRDRRGWRLFTEEEVSKMEAEANRISKMGIETY
jgi:excisionase family DNA binding protein